MQALRRRRRNMDGAFKLVENAANDEMLRSALAALEEEVKEGIKLEKSALTALERYTLLDRPVAATVAESFYIFGLLERVTAVSPSDFDWPSDLATLRRSVDEHFDRLENALLPAAIPLLTTNDLADLDQKIGPLELSRPPTSHGSAHLSLG